MEQITTNEIKLTEKEYFKLLTKKYFKNMKWWLLAPFLPIILHLIIQGKLDNVGFFFCLFFLSIPIYVIIYFYRFTHAKENNGITIGRTYKFTDNEVYTSIVDGSYSVIKLSHFIKVYKSKEYVLLYLNRISFFYLPRAAFDKDENYDAVIALVEDKINKTNS